MLFWKKLFILLGIPLLIFYIIMIIIYYAFLSSVWLIALIVGFFCLRKNRIWRRMTKLSIAMFVCVFILISNPFYWPSQIHRHIDPSLIVTPNAPAVQHLNETTEYWAYLNNTYSLNQSTYKNLTDYQKIHYVEDYCLDKIEYLNIQYIWWVIDYVATPTEVLQKGVGDCQHRTVVMVSFLIYLGYNAYCAECPLHWYPVVFLDNGSMIYLYHVNWTDPQVLINDKEVIFAMNLPQRLFDTLSHFSLNDPIRNLINTPIFWSIFLFCAFLISFLLVLLIKTSGVTTKKKKMTNILFGGTFFNLGFLCIMAISSIFPSITLISLIIVIILDVQLISHNFFMDPEAVDLENKNNVKIKKQ